MHAVGCKLMICCCLGLANSYMSFSAMVVSQSFEWDRSENLELHSERERERITKPKLASLSATGTPDSKPLNPSLTEVRSRTLCQPTERGDHAKHKDLPNMGLHGMRTERPIDEDHTLQSTVVST